MPWSWGGKKTVDSSLKDVLSNEAKLDMINSQIETRNTELQTLKKRCKAAKDKKVQKRLKEEMSAIWGTLQQLESTKTQITRTKEILARAALADMTADIARDIDQSTVAKLEKSTKNAEGSDSRIAYAMNIKSGASLDMGVTDDDFEAWFEEDDEISDSDAIDQSVDETEQNRTTSKLPAYY